MMSYDVMSYVYDVPTIAVCIGDRHGNIAVWRQCDSNADCDRLRAILPIMENDVKVKRVAMLKAQLT